MELRKAVGVQFESHKIVGSRVELSEVVEINAQTGKALGIDE